jgi:hypothetical protein
MNFPERIGVRVTFVAAEFAVAVGSGLNDCGHADLTSRGRAPVWDADGSQVTAPSLARRVSVLALHKELTRSYFPSRARAASWDSDG